ncbi:protein archease-like [Tropilaelaps mercedesae]|uniref:Protein archease-like n=1 Tax=Tropilaelaps mercedesae TaxID=418985 RepID=A0A1V9X3Y2_9ACAR|nr:protein archease-like [Tropilaelaps mercedesae]
MEAGPLEVDCEEWFETEEAVSCQKEFIPLPHLVPEDLLVPHVKYTVSVREDLMDIEFASHGDSLKEAFEQGAVAMYAYLYEPGQIEIKGYCVVEAEGRDLADLFYRFIDELQFALVGEPHLLVRKVEIVEFDEATFLLRAKCFGERFDATRHTSECRLETILKENVHIERSPEGHFEVRYTIDS